MLIWIGIKLLLPEDNNEHEKIEASDRLWSAVKTVIVADFVMSLDNVIAIAGAAEGAGGDHKMPLVIFGLLVSIPIIVWGSQIVIKLMERFPLVITLGAMLLGWIAGHMAVSDPAFSPYLIEENAREVSRTIALSASIGGALFVLLLGKFLGGIDRLSENWARRVAWRFISRSQTLANSSTCPSQLRQWSCSSHAGRSECNRHCAQQDPCRQSDVAHDAGGFALARHHGFQDLYDINGGCSFLATSL